MAKLHAKARLVPIMFEAAVKEEFHAQLIILKEMFAEEAEFLAPVMIGAPLPQADAIVFPQLIGEAYRKVNEIKQSGLPVVVITSEFGTVAMWDWEIVTFLKSHGVKVLAPYNVDITKTVLRAFALKKEMKSSKFLVFQDNPGEGMQPDIFKRFYWWEDACTQAIKDKFGIEIVKRSYEKLGADAKKVSDAEAKKALEGRNFNCRGVSERALYSAAKMYVALRNEIGGDESIVGIGTNCLNESRFSDTTPCLAWNMLYEDTGMMWICEADTLSLLTEHIVHSLIGAPVMMSNLYPFLMGMAALKHEKIKKFPDVADSDNHVLVVHCGYFGCMQRCWSSEWALVPKALAIVDENATMIDARFAEGPITIVKLHPELNSMLVIDGELDGYVQYPGSDTRNGALIKVKDGHRLMTSLYSHHACLVQNYKKPEMDFAAQVLDIELEKF
jgi:hypothetical protein